VSTGHQPAGSPNPSGATERLLRELYDRTEGPAFAYSFEQFQSTLLEIARKQRPAAGEAEILELLSKIKVEELVLARACASGNEKAWEVFLTRFRAKIYEIALAITRNDAAGRELADSVYAELYGVSAQGQERTSKLLYYSGRGSLEGWLRTVLAQDFVDNYRRAKPNVSLEEEQEHGFEPVAAREDPEAVPDFRLVPAIDNALAKLAPEDRLLLSTYFLDGRTLAEIARVLKVHESTISRKLERTTAELRKSILRALVEAGMSKRQAEEALEADVRDLAVDLRASLQESSVKPFSWEKEER
jgi:RNA polymerase sigma-70 factor (ECF subfamily)